MLKPIDPDKLAAANQIGTGIAKIPVADVAPASALNFARQMQATHHRVAQDTMVAFLAEIDEQGKRLAKHPIRAEIERYRSLVGKFLKDAMSQMTTLEKHTDRRNRSFTLVKEVDKKLAELTELLLGGQAKQLDILTKLHEIQGMLVDLKI